MLRAMNKRYRNPPIQEALCEFRFAPSRDWDLTIPGKLHNEVIREYGAQPQEQRVLQATLKTSEDGSPEMQAHEEIAKLMLINGDGTRMIGVGRDIVSVHMMEPYQTPNSPEKSGWKEFQPRIKQALNAYWHVAAPLGVTRIGVRYINRISVPERVSSIKSYLKTLVKCAPPDIGDFPGTMNNMTSRVEYNCGNNVTLVLSQYLIRPESAPLNFFLDIDVIWNTSGEPITPEGAHTKTDLLKQQENEVFEALITNKAREHFNAN